MKKLTDFLKPNILIILGALLFLYYMNWLSNQGAGLAIGIVAVICAIYYIAIGVLEIIVSNKFSPQLKKIFELISVSLFAIFMFLFFLLSAVQGAKIENYMGPTAWIIAILSMVASLALVAIYAISKFVEKSLLLQMGNNKSIEIGIPNNGYIRIYVRGLNELNQYVLYNSFVSLIKGDFDAISEFLNNENLVNQETELSLVSYVIQSYSAAISSTTGPKMAFNLDGATFECSVDYGSFSYYENIQTYTATSGEIVMWSVSYFDNYGTSDQTKIHIMPEMNDVSYMDIIIRMNDDIIGYIIIEMKHVGNAISYEINAIDSYLFKDESNNFASVSHEYIICVINESKERTLI